MPATSLLDGIGKSGSQHGGMKLGFARSDITPRVGVELCGFGPFLCRHSIGVHERLWARAMAIEAGGERAVVVSCDLIGTSRAIVTAVRERVAAATGLAADEIMVLSTHTHSGPATVELIGWGQHDQPYLEGLPARVARACIDAVAGLREATLSHAEVPCEGIGQNREYDRDNLPAEVVLAEGWRPDKPELTDTTCHVLKAEADGELLGFVSYFGCHPVVCCQQTRYLHGDFCGVATGIIEREFPGSVGLFIQGAQGDVNPSFVHKPEAESLRALGIIGGRYADCIRAGLSAARPLAIDGVATVSAMTPFRRRNWDLAKLRSLLAEKERLVTAAKDDSESDPRLALAEAIALRRMIAAHEAGADPSSPLELQGLRLGPLVLLASPFETFQAIKNDIVRGSRADVTLVASFGNDCVGYAVDHTAAARGGYAADLAPVLYGKMPFASVHDDLVAGMLAVDRELDRLAQETAAR